MNNYLMLDPANDRYHGATHKSNNTGEVTAIGEVTPGFYNNHPIPSSATKSAPIAITELMRWMLCRVGTAPESETGH